jgi:hypothetical protein
VFFVWQILILQRLDFSAKNVKKYSLLLYLHVSISFTVKKQESQWNDWMKADKNV